MSDNQQEIGWSIRVLGDVAVSRPNGEHLGLSDAIRHLLGVLVAAGPEGASQHTIADELWAEQLPASWESSFRNGVTRLRKLMGRSAIQMASGKYRISDAIAVDAWRLIELVKQGDPPPVGESFVRLLAGPLFGGVEASTLIQSASAQIEASRVELISEAIEQRKEFRPAELQALRMYQLEHPFEENLLEDIALAHASSGERTRALALLMKARKFLSNHSTRTSTRMASLEEAIRLDRLEAFHRSERGQAGSPIHRTVPNQLIDLRSDSHVGRATDVRTALELIRATKSVMVSGPSGVGKTRLVAAIADELVRQGLEVRYASANSLDQPLEIVTRLLPGVQEKVATALNSTADPAAIRNRCITSILEEIGTERREPLCLILDDAHALGSLSELALHAMLRQIENSNVSIVVAGQTEGDRWRWVSGIARATNDGVSHLTLRPLALPAVAELVQLQRPVAVSALRKRLAEEVIALSGGLPGIARHIIDLTDPETLLLDRERPDYVLQSSPLAIDLADLDFATRKLGCAAAVIGTVFDLPDLVQIGDTNKKNATSCCEQLESLGFIRETYGLDRYTFVHSLHHRAALECVSAKTRRSLHRSAAEFSPDARRYAQHMADAVPLVAKSEAARSLVAVSHEYFGEARWRESAEAMIDAEKLDPRTPSIGDLVLVASALDCSGADGSPYRRRSFELAAKDGMWPLALEAALSGLPSAERLHGDPDRVNLLERIPIQMLGPFEQFRLASALVRQLMFIGRDEEARIWSKKAREFAEGPDRLLIAYINDVLVGGQSDSNEVGRLPCDIADASDPHLAVGSLQIASLNQLERLSADQARPLRIEYALHVEELNDPYRTWHHMVLSATELIVAGEWEKGLELSLSANDHGYLYGIGDASTAHLAQQLFPFWVHNDLDQLEPKLEDYRSSGKGLLNRCMTAMIEVACGADDIAHDRLDVGAICRSQSYFAVSCLCLVADVVANQKDPQLMAAVSSRLEPRTGSSAIVGNGAAHAGPVDRALAVLSQEPTAKETYLRRACAVADMQRLVTWQVQCRLELFKHCADLTAYSEARNLATTDDLQALLAN